VRPRYDRESSDAAPQRGSLAEVKGSGVKMSLGLAGKEYNQPADRRKGALLEENAAKRRGEGKHQSGGPGF